MVVSAWQGVLHAQVVAPLLPGGHLRAGFLLAADPATQRTTLERWVPLFGHGTHDITWPVLAVGPGRACCMNGDLAAQA